MLLLLLLLLLQVVVEFSGVERGATLGQVAVERVAVDAVAGRRRRRRGRPPAGADRRRLGRAERLVVGRVAWRRQVVVVVVLRGQKNE